MKKLLNVVVYGLLVYSILAGVHASLPVEYQISGFSNLTALVSGASTALVGSAGVYLKSLLKKTETTTDEKVGEVVKGFIELAQQLKTLKDEVAKLTTETEKIANERFKAQLKATKRLTRLVETDLQAKLSNKFIDEEVRALIKGTIEDEEEMV